MNRKLGVLIHGAGWVSTQHVDAFMGNPHTDVVAISSRKIRSAGDGDERPRRPRPRTNQPRSRCLRRG